MKTACMVVHSYYPADPRVRREAESLVDDGWAVDVICLRDGGQPRTEECGGAMVYRIPVRRHRGSGLVIYLLEYLAFFLLASLCVAWLHLRRRYDVVQAHNMPDFLVFTGLIPRLLGARVVLDIHDLVPELYASKFGGSPDHPLVRMTQRVERASIAFADQVITAGEPFRRRLLAREVPADKVAVVMNSADQRLFYRRRPSPAKRRSPGTFTLMYHGGLFERYGVDIAIRAVARLREAIPGIRFEIYGQGEAAGGLQRLIEELELGTHVHLGGFVPLDQIPRLIARAQMGVIPYRKDPFTDLLYPTKAFEYLTIGVPVIMAHTGAVVELFANVPEIFFEPEDVDDLARLILALCQDPARMRRLLRAAYASYAPYAWQSQRARYLLLMRQLTAVREVTPSSEHL